MGTVVVAFLAGACSAPRVGDPCTPTHDASPVVGEGGGVLICTGPAGCDPSIEFRYIWDEEANSHRYCGCDGVTHQPRELPYPYGGEWHAGHPTGRYLWLGSCEDPCRGVTFTDLGVHVDGSRATDPVAPQCYDCTDAHLDADGNCLGPDGLSKADSCCWE